MESPRQMRRLIEKLLLLGLLALTGWAAFAQLQSPALRALANKEDQTIYVAILTQPAMTLAYNPAQHKVHLTTHKRRKTPQAPQENAQDVFKKAGIRSDRVRYYLPQNTHRDEYWEHFKGVLGMWRYNPLLAARAVWDYTQACHDKRTNISAGEFLLLMLDASRLEITDFTVRHAGEEPKKKSSAKKATVAADGPPAPTPDLAPLALQDRPLTIDVLNASGKKGAARELTQYLREKSQKGLLRVDVLQQDNYPGGRQKISRIVDYTGRLVQLKQLSTAIGLNNEIVSEKSDNAICDAAVIIGEDFKQPL